MENDKDMAKPFDTSGKMARAILRDRWRVAAGSGPDRLLVENIREHRGVCIWVRINRQTGRVNPHDGSMFAAPNDEGSKGWAKTPQYVKKFVEEHGRDMLEHSYPTPELGDWEPSYNTINGQKMDGRGFSL